MAHLIDRPSLACLPVYLSFLASFSALPDHTTGVFAVRT